AAVRVTAAAARTRTWRRPCGRAAGTVRGDGRPRAGERGLGLVARRVSVELVDDLDGGAADRTVAVGLDGHWYEIDLSAANEQALRVGLAPFLAAARPARGSGGGTTRRRTARNAATDTARAGVPEVGPATAAGANAGAAGAGAADGAATEAT